MVSTEVDFSLIGSIFADKMNIDLQDLDIKIEDDYDPRVQGREDVLAKPQKVRLIIERFVGVSEGLREEFIKKFVKI